MISSFSLWEPFIIWLQQLIKHWAKPTNLSLVNGALSDLSRSRADLVVENALLRQQLIILNRHVKRPGLTSCDRFRLVLIARCTWFWKQALHIVQPDTFLRWHRELFRIYWRLKSKGKQVKAKIPDETIALIRKMAEESLMGSRADSGRTSQVGNQGV